jgi:hypothetical protein
MSGVFSSTKIRATTTNPGAHLRDSFIVAKVGIARMRDRFPSRAVKLDKTDPPEDLQKYKIHPRPVFSKDLTHYIRILWLSSTP